MEPLLAQKLLVASSVWMVKYSRYAGPDSRRDVDPRTPVLVGAGQLSQRVDHGEQALEPVDLMEQALLRAEQDSKTTGLLRGADSVRVMGLLSWRYGDPGGLVAEKLGAHPSHTAVTVMGGNYPQTVLNRAAADISRGRCDIVLICGAEAWRSRSAARREDRELDWTTQPEGTTPTQIYGADDPELNGPAEVARGIVLPIQIYPMFESALRASQNLGMDEHRQQLGRLWSSASQVAATNPHAWIQRHYSAEEIATPSAQNRMVGFPYTKLMNSNNNVEQGAGLILCSAARARLAGIPRDRWIFPLAGTDAHDHWHVSERADMHSSPAIAIAGRRCLELAGADIDDVAHMDLYSCFPSAVQIAAKELAIGKHRQFTVTGGMSFAGGPWNNYVTHSIATMVDVLREDPGSLGLITANGGFTTKHSFGLYSTQPQKTGFRWDNPQMQVDLQPRRHAASDHSGPATLEAYTVMHDRTGEPETALGTCLTSDGARTWVRSTDPAVMDSMETTEWVGTEVYVDPDGTIKVP